MNTAANSEGDFWQKDLQSLEEYLGLNDVDFYMKDALSQLIESRHEKPAVFLHSYFFKVCQGDHIQGRHFDYILATRRNQAAFLKVLSKYLTKLPVNVEYDLEEWSQLVSLSCPSMPKHYAYPVALTCLSKEQWDTVKERKPPGIPQINAKQQQQHSTHYHSMDLLKPLSQVRVTMEPAHWWRHFSLSFFYQPFLLSLEKWFMNLFTSGEATQEEAPNIPLLLQDFYQSQQDELQLPFKIVLEPIHHSVHLIRSINTGTIDLTVEWAMILLILLDNAILTDHLRQQLQQRYQIDLGST